jgi:hypothetical protein
LSSRSALSPLFYREIRLGSWLYLDGTNNKSTCPSQYNSGEDCQKSESAQRESINCQEPQNLAPLSAHASHPSSGCFTPENPISKCGIREHYRCDTGRADLTLNGTISGNTISAIPERPTTKSHRPIKNGRADARVLGSAVNVPAAITNKPTRQVRAIPCDAHCDSDPSHRAGCSLWWDNYTVIGDETMMSRGVAVVNSRNPRSTVCNRDWLRVDCFGSWAGASKPTSAYST